MSIRRRTATAYAAVSHAGHGVNSYGLNVYIVTDDIAVFVQHGWGGVYADPAKEHAEIARTYLLLRELLLAKKIPADRRAVLMYSDFRQVACFFRAAREVILPLNPAVEQFQPGGNIDGFSDFTNRSRAGYYPGPELSSLEVLFAHVAKQIAVKETLGRGLELLIGAAAMPPETAPQQD